MVGLQLAEWIKLWIANPDTAGSIQCPSWYLDTGLRVMMSWLQQTIVKYFVQLLPTMFEEFILSVLFLLVFSFLIAFLSHLASMLFNVLFIPDVLSQPDNNYLSVSKLPLRSMTALFFLHTIDSFVKFPHIFPPFVCSGFFSFVTFWHSSSNQSFFHRLWAASITSRAAAVTPLWIVSHR